MSKNKTYKHSENQLVFLSGMCGCGLIQFDLWGFDSNVAKSWSVHSSIFSKRPVLIWNKWKQRKIQETVVNLEENQTSLVLIKNIFSGSFKDSKWKPSYFSLDEPQLSTSSLVHGTVHNTVALKITQQFSKIFLRTEVEVRRLCILRWTRSMKLPHESSPRLHTSLVQISAYCLLMWKFVVIVRNTMKLWAHCSK